MRLFFHLNECGTRTLDEEGMDLPDLDVARSTAIIAAREVMCAEISEGRLCMSCHIDVHDAAGEYLFRLPFADALTITGL